MVRGNHASAAPPRYRVADLTELGFTPAINTHGSMGLNNKGQVAYGFMADGQIHAFAWLPEPDYNRVAGLHDLTALSGSNAPGIARDINMSGIAVGQSGAMGDQAGLASAWTIDTSISHSNLGSLGAPPGVGGAWSSAHAINDALPDPVIVGDTSIAGDCDCPVINPQLDDRVIRAFKLTFTTPPPPPGSMDPLNPNAEGNGDTGSWGRDINTLIGGGSVTSGYSRCLPCLGGSPGVCSELSRDALTWGSPNPVDQDEFEVDRASENRAINNSNESVGWGLDENNPCVQRALYWDSPTADLFNLGAVMPSGQENEASRAEGLNNMSWVQVAGWNVVRVEGFLWEQQSSTTWTVTELNAAVSIGGCAAKWTVRQAHDVNDYGWIIAWGVLDADVSKLHALLLIPYGPCPADLTGDGLVNASDLLAVVATYGPCPTGSICWADVTGDCTVNVQDLLAVVAAYGNCPSGMMSGPEGGLSIEEQIAVLTELLAEHPELEEEIKVAIEYLLNQ